MYKVDPSKLANEMPYFDKDLAAPVCVFAKHTIERNKEKKYTPLKDRNRSGKELETINPDNVNIKALAESATGKKQYEKRAQAIYNGESDPMLQNAATALTEIMRKTEHEYSMLRGTIQVKNARDSNGNLSVQDSNKRSISDIAKKTTLRLNMLEPWTYGSNIWNNARSNNNTQRNGYDDSYRQRGPAKSYRHKKDKKSKTQSLYHNRPLDAGLEGTINKVYKGRVDSEEEKSKGYGQDNPSYGDKKADYGRKKKSNYADIIRLKPYPAVKGALRRAA